MICSMASEAPHYPTLFLFFILLSVCIKCNSAGRCPPFDCGNGITMGYPFWLESQQFEHCGYPGFGILCKEKSPMLNISSHLYKIKTYNESERTFTLITYGTDDQESNDLSCPVARHDVTLNSSSLMDYAARDVKMMHFFYNCSLYPPTLLDIKCLRFDDKHSYVFVDGSVPEFDWQRYCDSIVTVPMIDQMANNHLGDLVANGFGRVLLQGFKLTWKPELACQSCEATGGFCGHRTSGINQKFICYCSDGQHHSNCQNSGAVPISSNQPNYIATGLLIFGVLVAASTVLYHIQKKKISISRNGFSQLPICRK